MKIEFQETRMLHYRKEVTLSRENLEEMIREYFSVEERSAIVFKWYTGRDGDDFVEVNARFERIDT